ncbi:MAG: SdiA-regulated domain-containing protein [Cyclobacteriaceae bacterium]
MSKTLLPLFIIGILVIFSLQVSCERPYRTLADSLYHVSGKTYSYNLNEVENKYFLPYVLEEVSGLAYYKDAQVAMVNDEEGRMFLYDLNKKDIDKAIRFAGSGDYEGIEIINSTAYVLKSNGDLYHFEISDDREVDSKKIETPLSKDNDLEGLGYDPQRNRLMLVCKGKSEIGKDKVEGQAVYGYDLDQEDFKKDPEFTISKKKLEEFFETAKNQAYDAGKITFRPSGIALHPFERQWYMIASAGKLLIAVDDEGEIQASYPIPPRLLSQPEGICFLPNGNMLISSEGEGDRGYIIEYKMKKTL